MFIENICILDPEEPEYQLIQQLRERSPAQQPSVQQPTWGERLADRVAAIVGSWKFIVIQSILLALWISINIIGTFHHWDPYPFILLNLVLSFQAAYTAPIIMMSQNRQAQIDRQDARHDYEVNLKSELEIELLHDKMNLLREEEVVEMIQILKKQSEYLESLKLLSAKQKKLDQLEQKLDLILQQATSD